MSWEIITINVLGAVVLVLGFAVWNLMTKNEKLEDVIISYRDYISKFQEHITLMEKKVKKIDEKGTFQSDDEIGWFFRSIKGIQESISKFKVDI